MERVGTSLVRAAVMLACIAVVGCGGAEPERRPARVARREAAPPPPPPPREARQEAQIVGIIGTLSRDEIERSLTPRMDQFGECFFRHSRRLRTLGGRIQFAFRVGTDGSVASVRPTESTIGHRDVERCLVEVAAATRFPQPHGGEAELTWPLELDPPDGVSHPEDLDPSVMASVVERHGGDIIEECEAPRSTAFQVTVYIARNGRVLSVGGITSDPAAEESLDCVLSAVRRWRLRQRDRMAKVTFELRR